MSKVTTWLRAHPLTALFLVLVGFALGMHFFANWRVEVRWERYCAEARARGVKLTLAELAPPKIDGATPRLGALIDAAKLSQTRMREHLAAGDSAAAYADFQVGFQSYSAWENVPTQLSGMAQIAVLQLLCDATSEGLRDGSWAEPELRKLEVELGSLRLGKVYFRSFSGERGRLNTTLDQLIASAPTKRAQLFGGRMHFQFIPQCVFRDNQLRLNQHYDKLLARLSEDGTRFVPEIRAASDPDNLTGLLDPYYFFIFPMSGGFNRGRADEFVKMQTRLDQTRLAIALERFHLARGGFPETLAELVPEFIAAVPVETYSQQPMIYRRTEGETFVLYGVGKNGTDAGGVADAKGGDGEGLDDVWLYAPAGK